MCGITGIVSSSPSNLGGTIRKMTEALTHRGPDDWGYVSLNPGEAHHTSPTKMPANGAARVWLGHRRLSIIDLAGSQQPLSNEDGTVWIVFNGEIYNYQSLRTYLSKKGHRLKTAGDTEVLVHLWEEHKEEMLGHLIGMFAFVLYDTRRDLLFMARDRFGQKPLFYWNTPYTLAFGSELQSLWALKEFPEADLDPIAVCQYFRYGYIPSPRTVFKEVNSLLPGHYLTLQKQHSRITPYWQPEVCGGSQTFTHEDCKHLLDGAVKDRLQADVPLGAFLSGGVDSSLIVASMVRQTNSPVETFTVAMPDTSYDESTISRLTAGYLQTNHHELNVSPDFVDASRKLARHFGQPFADYSAIPTYYVSRETRRHVTVALSGDGGDELFAGYRRYQHHRWSTLAGAFPLRIRQMLSLMVRSGCSFGLPSIDPVEDFLLSAGSVRDKGENHSSAYHSLWQARCFQPDLLLDIEQNGSQNRIARFKQLYDEAVSTNPLEKWLEVDQRMYLPEDIMTKVDITSMAVSLECRCPFLDHRLAEMVNHLPMYTKLQGGKSKILLRQLALTQVPEVVSTLPKKGFVIPLATWLRSTLKDWAHDILFHGTPSWDSYLNPKAVRSLWSDHQSGRRDHSKRLWMVIAWSLWSETLKHRTTEASLSGGY